MVPVGVASPALCCTTKMDKLKGKEMTDSNNKWLETVEKLMRKAEDPATTQEERDSLTDKITYLMTKYGIEQDMLKAEANEPINAERRNFKIANPYADKKVLLLSTVAQAFGCVCINALKTQGNAAVFGTMADIEHVYMLYASLIIQMNGAMASAEKPQHVHGKAFNNSFVSGYIITVRERVMEAANRAKQDIRREHSSGNGMELVLLNKAQVVKNLVHNDFPFLRSSNTRFSASSGAGYAAGQSAGRMADIGGSRISSNHATRRAIS